MTFIKERITDGTTRGLFISSGTEIAVELAAAAGVDWLILDMEHGLGNEDRILAMIRCLGESRTVPLVRIPALRREYISRVLDFGAAGIVCPAVESAEMARTLVEYMRYPPEGSRGLTASSRASCYGRDFKAYFSEVHSKLLAVAQIETAEGVDHVDAVAAVGGIDVLFIGHSDLSANLDCYGAFDHPSIMQAETAVVEAASRHHKTAGMLLKQNMKETEYLQRGFQFMAMGSDIGCLRSAYKRLLRSGN